jgi:ribosome recycling factor
MEYILKKELKSEKAIIKVYSPNISEEERNTRMKLIHKAAENLLKGAVKNVQN